MEMEKEPISNQTEIEKVSSHDDLEGAAPSIKTIVEGI